MTKIGKLWTDSVAYVALITGAAVSIAGNVVDTQRTRGDQMDAADVVIAVLFPALVVLMVEVFVSSRWRGLATPMQWLRWAGCSGVTVVAMRISWVHLNDLMLSRGQKVDVAILGPLAIDFLAVMATALILAGRTAPAVIDDAPDPLPDVIGVPVVPEQLVTQPIDPAFTWTDDDDEMLKAVAEPAPVRTRQPRGEISPALKSAIVFLIEGVPASKIETGPGASTAVIGRYARVIRILRADPHAVIDIEKEKVRSALVEEIRAAMREDEPR